MLSIFRSKGIISPVYRIIEAWIESLVSTLNTDLETLYYQHHGPISMPVSFLGMPAIELSFSLKGSLQYF